MKKISFMSLFFLLLFVGVVGTIAQTQQSPAVFTPMPDAVNFVNLSTEPGAVLVGQGDDVLFQNIAMPFPFSIYGAAPSTCLDISTNGFIADCVETLNDFGNSCPYPDGANPRIALLHDDLDIELGSPSQIWYKSFPANSPNHPGHPNAGTSIDAFVIHYKDAQRFPGQVNPPPGNIFNFAAVLY